MQRAGQDKRSQASSVGVCFDCVKEWYTAAVIHQRRDFHFFFFLSWLEECRETIELMVQVPVQFIFIFVRLYIVVVFGLNRGERGGSICYEEDIREPLWSQSRNLLSFLNFIRPRQTGFSSYVLQSCLTLLEPGRYAKEWWSVIVCNHESDSLRDNFVLCIFSFTQSALWPQTRRTVNQNCAQAAAAWQPWRDRLTSSRRSNRAPRTWSRCTPTDPPR